MDNNRMKSTSFIMARCTKGAAAQCGARRTAKDLRRLPGRHLGNFDFDAEFDFTQHAVKLGLPRTILEGRCRKSATD